MFKVRLNVHYLVTWSRKMSKHQVFVYGTLKSGEPNYQWMNKFKEGYFKFVSKGRTEQKYPLIIASKYNIPFLLNAPGTGHNVKGEIYEVDDKMLSHLDILEDHPTFYERELENIITEPGSEVTQCWIYLIKKFRPDLLKLPYMESYESEGAHGQRYCERYLRQDENYNVKDDIQTSLS